MVLCIAVLKESSINFDPLISNMISPSGVLISNCSGEISSMPLTCRCSLLIRTKGEICGLFRSFGKGGMHSYAQEKQVDYYLLKLAHY